MAYPRAAADYYQRQQQILTLLLTAVRQLWRRMNPDRAWGEQYEQDGIGAQLVLLVAAAQTAAARDADAYIAEVLVELGTLDAAAPTAAPGVVVPSAFAGVAGDGRGIDSLFALAVPRAGQALTAAVRDLPDPIAQASESARPDSMSDTLWRSTVQAREKGLLADFERQRKQLAQQVLDEAGRWLEEVAATAVIDAARAAESAASTARPEVAGYVRMLNPPSCSRCAVLAGRFYRWDADFERHPRCDCRSIPVSESLAGDYTVDPDAYFQSLPTAAELEARYPDLTVKKRREAGLISQEDVFTADGARAIRDGADVGQVVNARRGMEAAQVYGRDVVITREGVTIRGRYGAARGALEKKRGRRYSASTQPRLMPSSIYQIAQDRADAIRLLRLNGFIT